MNARLPDELLEPTIAGMYPGTTGYAVPWAMVVDENKNCWIRGDYGIADSPGGTVQMKVHRTNGGFEVTTCPDFLYSPEQISEDDHRAWNLKPVTRIR